MVASPEDRVRHAADRDMVFPETESDDTRLTLMQGMAQDFPWVRQHLIEWLKDLYPEEMKSSE